MKSLLLLYIASVCLYLLTELTLYHSAVSVSYISMHETVYSGLLVLPPMITSLLPKNVTKCWYLPIGTYPSVRGGVAQSHVPFLCLTKPQISLSADTDNSLCEPLWSFLVYLLPPNTTIIPATLPVSHRAAEW